jgi:hypothetical protein
MRRDGPKIDPPSTDGRGARYPVSIKGVVFIDGRVVLLQNERDEWELPGGRLEPGVLIVTYGCRTRDAELVVSHEHKAVGLFQVSELSALNMPEGYRASVRAWAKLAQP